MMGIDGVINWRRGKSIIPYILELKRKPIHNGYYCAYSIARLSEIWDLYWYYCGVVVLGGEEHVTAMENYIILLL